AQQWEGARCDLNTKHYLVNSGVIYLKSATETKFVDKRAKDLKDADKMLHEALATGGQEKHPAAWYYLARYYALQNDLAGADSSAKYFKLAVPAASDPKFAKEKRDALFNVARVYHADQRWDGAVAGYKDYLAAYPNDVQAIAGLAAIYSHQGKREDAGALYN